MLCENCKKENGIKKAYGLKPQIVNSYHVKLRHEDYTGWFDWYHTTGTIVANPELGKTTKIGKTKDAEETALIISHHIKTCTH